MRSAASGIGGGSTLPKLPAPAIRVAQLRVKSKEENVMNVLAIGRDAQAGLLAFEQLTEFTTLRHVIDRGAVIRS
jgi:hypothetical protein